MLSNGYHDVPKGCLASVVTHLEMHARPELRPEAELSLRLERMKEPSIGWYQALFREVGEDYLWFGRLTQDEESLRAVIHDTDVHIYALKSGDATAGLLELDFRTKGECELAYFGLSSEFVGGGAGRWLINRAITLAWQAPIQRFHVHTCTLDHPNALGFYIRSGFTPYKRQIEVAPDPRQTGILPKSAAPHIPMI